MFCFNCGTEVDENVKFCFNCGTKLDGVTKSVNVQSKSNTEMKKENYYKNMDIEKMQQRQAVTRQEKFTETEIKLYTKFKKLVETERNLSFERIGKKIYDDFYIENEEETFAIYFNYGSKGNEGFFVTTNAILARFEGECFQFDYDMCDRFGMGKFMLANVLYAYNGAKKSEEKLFLTGIRNIDDFIKLLNEFLTERRIEMGIEKTQVNSLNKDVVPKEEYYAILNEFKSKIAAVEPLLLEKKELSDKRRSLGMFNRSEKKKLDQRIVELNYKIGSIVTFGRYPQGENGEIQDVNWIPIHIDETYVILLSLYGLDNEKYHICKEAISWERCSLRKWLNREFYDKCFNEKEKALMKVYDAETPEDREYSSKKYLTQDKVFLLSRPEVYEWLALADGYVYPTEYVLSKEMYMKKDRAQYWCLRTPGDNLRELHKIRTLIKPETILSVSDATSEVVRPTICVQIK